MRSWQKKMILVSVLALVLAGAAAFAYDAVCGVTAMAVTTNNVGVLEANESAQAGLLIIAHGAPMPAWNKPVLEIEPEIVKALGLDSPFKKVKVVMMEFAEPSVTDGIMAMEEAGCDQIVAVPLLIAPSSHSHWDIPALLGIYSDQKMEKELKAEGATIVRSKLPICVTATLDQGDILLEAMLSRVKELSKNPKEEAVVVLAHGDEGLQPYWDRLMKRITHYVCGKTGITYADWAYVEVGQSYSSNGVPAIAEAAEHRQRVLLVGCYISMGANGIHQRYMKRPLFIPGMGALPNPLKGKDIVAAKYGLLPDPKLAGWIAETAKKALGK